MHLYLLRARVGFGMSVPQCVFLSCAVDVINSGVLGVFYLLQRRVNLFFVVVLAPPAALFTVLFYLILGKYVTSRISYDRSIVR